MTKTYFNGAITQQQLISIVITIIAIAVILSLAKKVIKLVLSVSVIVIALIYFEVMSPEQLKDVSKVVSEQGKEVFTQVANTSKNIKVSNKDNNLDIQVCIDGSWINVKDISSFIKSKDNYTVVLDGKEYVVKDGGIMQLLDILEK